MIIAKTALISCAAKPISIKTEQVISRVGFALIISLALVVTYNDVLKFKDQIFKFFVR